MEIHGIGTVKRKVLPIDTNPDYLNIADIENLLTGFRESIEFFRMNYGMGVIEGVEICAPDSFGTLGLTLFKIRSNPDITVCGMKESLIKSQCLRTETAGFQQERHEYSSAKHVRINMFFMKVLSNTKIYNTSRQEEINMNKVHIG